MLHWSLGEDIFHCFRAGIHVRSEVSNRAESPFRTRSARRDVFVQVKGNINLAELVLSACEAGGTPLERAVRFKSLGILAQTVCISQDSNIRYVQIVSG